MAEVTAEPVVGTTPAPPWTVQRVVGAVLAYVHMFSAMTAFVLSYIPLELFRRAILCRARWEAVGWSLLAVGGIWMLCGVCWVAFRLVDPTCRPWKQMLEESGDQWT